MGFSGVVDVLWLLIWGMFWNNSDYYPKGYWENTIHHFVLALSIINLLIKVSLGISLISAVYSNLNHFIDCCIGHG